MHEDEWGSGKLDLNAYLSRINHPKAEPTLQSLQRAHVLAMPWNNLDMVLHRPVGLDIESVQEKLLTQRRGGTCSEHTILFAAALTRLGFQVTGMSGRIQLGSGSIRPATHGLLKVAAEDRVWICDVGFGGSPLEPIELVDGADSVQDDWHYRVTREEDHWALHSRRSGEWVTVHTFTEDRRYPVDYVLTHHYVSTHPRSPFSSRLFAQRVSGRAHQMLDNRQLTTTYPERSPDVQQLTSAEVIEVLANVFEAPIPAADVTAVLATVGHPHA